MAFGAQKATRAGYRVVRNPGYLLVHEPLVDGLDERELLQQFSALQQRRF